MTETWHPWFLKDLRQLYQCEEERDLQYGKTQLPHWNKRREETREIEQRMPRFVVKRQKVKLSATLSTSCDERNLRDLHLKHHHMSAAQFKKRRTHLDIPGNIYDLYQHVMKTCPFRNSIKPRRERSRVRGLRAEEYGDLIFLDHRSAKIEDKTYGCLNVLDGATSHLTA